MTTKKMYAAMVDGWVGEYTNIPLDATTLAQEIGVDNFPVRQLSRDLAGHTGAEVAAGIIAACEVGGFRCLAAELCAAADIVDNYVPVWHSASGRMVDGRTKVSA